MRASSMSNYIQRFSYNHWANLRLVQTTSQLDVAAFQKEFTSSFASLQHTFVHIIWAEELWLARWEERKFDSVYNPGGYPHIERVQIAFNDLFERQTKFLNSLQAGDGERRINYVNSRGEICEYPLAQMMEHLLNHSTFHRGQIVTLLRQLGVAPPGTDYLIYIDTTGVRG